MEYMIANRFRRCSGIRVMLYSWWSWIRFVGKRVNGSWTIGNYAVAMSGCLHLILGWLMWYAISRWFEGGRVLEGWPSDVENVRNYKLRYLCSSDAGVPDGGDLEVIWSLWMVASYYFVLKMLTIWRRLGTLVCGRGSSTGWRLSGVPIFVLGVTSAFGRLRFKYNRELQLMIIGLTSSR